MKVSDEMARGSWGQSFFCPSRHHAYQIKSFIPSDGHEHGDLKLLFIPSLTSIPEYIHFSVASGMPMLCVSLGWDKNAQCALLYRHRWGSFNFIPCYYCSVQSLDIQPHFAIPDLILPDTPLSRTKFSEF